jgi:hypothetical protein
MLVSCFSILIASERALLDFYSLLADCYLLLSDVDASCVAVYMIPLCTDMGRRGPS